MVTKYWCDCCLMMKEGVHLDDAMCMDCGKMETVCSCHDCRYKAIFRKLVEPCRNALKTT